jgi:hypothetical protein
MSTNYKIIRWYAQDKKVFDRLVTRGILKGAIYAGWTKAEHWTAITMRDRKPKEALGVIDGLRAFGGLRDIKKAITRFHGHGAVIVDIDTGQDSLTHGVDMFDAATGPRKFSAEYSKALQDERADKRRNKKGQMSRHDAQAIWLNPKLKTAEKAKLTRWSRAALYDAFGKSNSLTGRPPKQIAA